MILLPRSEDDKYVDFNTYFHEAVSIIPVTEENLDRKIIDNQQNRYTLNGKVLRHSKVIVRKFNG